MVVARLLGNGDCVVDHERSRATLRTSKSPEFGGTGTSFSSTDLLLTALVTCIATDIEPVAVRNGVDVGRIRLRGSKTLSTNPKRVVSLEVTVEIAGEVETLTLQKLQRAADACLVQRSLHPDVACTIDWAVRHGD